MASQQKESPSGLWGYESTRDYIGNTWAILRYISGKKPCSQSLPDLHNQLKQVPSQDWNRNKSIHFWTLGPFLLQLGGVSGFRASALGFTGFRVEDLS